MNWIELKSNNFVTREFNLFDGIRHFKMMESEFRFVRNKNCKKGNKLIRIKGFSHRFRDFYDLKGLMGAWNGVDKKNQQNNRTLHFDENWIDQNQEKFSCQSYKSVATSISQRKHKTKNSRTVIYHRQSRFT